MGGRGWRVAVMKSMGGRGWRVAVMKSMGGRGWRVVVMKSMGGSGWRVWKGFEKTTGRRLCLYAHTAKKRENLILLY